MAKATEQQRKQAAKLRQRGWTLEQTAKVVGVSIATISHWEGKGRRKERGLLPYSEARKQAIKELAAGASVERVASTHCLKRNVVEDLAKSLRMVKEAVGLTKTGRLKRRWKQLSTEKKKRAVLETKTKTVVEVAEKYGVTPATVYNWKRRYKTKVTSKDMAALIAENDQLLSLLKNNR